MHTVLDQERYEDKNYVLSFDKEIEALYNQSRKDINRQLWTEKFSPRADLRDYLYFLWIYLPYILIATLCMVSTCLALTALLSGF